MYNDDIMKELKLEPATNFIQNQWTGHLYRMQVTNFQKSCFIKCQKKRTLMLPIEAMDREEMEYHDA